jgi:hypothetical protein
MHNSSLIPVQSGGSKVLSVVSARGGAAAKGTFLALHAALQWSVVTSSTRTRGKHRDITVLAVDIPAIVVVVECSLHH